MLSGTQWFARDENNNMKQYWILILYINDFRIHNTHLLANFTSAHQSAEPAAEACVS